MRSGTKTPSFPNLLNLAKSELRGKTLKGREDGVHMYGEAIGELETYALTKSGTLRLLTHDPMTSYSTLSPSSSTSSSTVIKQPRPLSYTGSTPLRDLILAEQFGAAVDARGDLWCWGDGYDGDVAEGERSGKAGRSLTGKVSEELRDSRQQWSSAGDS